MYKYYWINYRLYDLKGQVLSESRNGTYRVYTNNHFSNLRVDAAQSILIKELIK